jgi:hypothetical protein
MTGPDPYPGDDVDHDQDDGRPDPPDVPDVAFLTDAAGPAPDEPDVAP